MSGFNVAVVGAMGAVGGEMIRALEQRGFPMSERIPLDGVSKAGCEVRFRSDRVVFPNFARSLYAGLEAAFGKADAGAPRPSAGQTAVLPAQPCPSRPIGIEESPK